MSNSPVLLHPVSKFSKRRRKLIIRRFMELSSLVPAGSNEMDDESSIVENATEYLKQLQERVNTLEQANITNSSSAAAISNIIAHDHHRGESSSSSDQYLSSHEDVHYPCDVGCHSDENLPEIKVRAEGDNVLIRIHCEKKAGFPAKALTEIENLHMTISDASALSFGHYFLEITVNAKKGGEFYGTAKDLESNLRLALVD